MNVSLGAHLEDFVHEIVKSGRFGSVSEVVREGIRLVEEREAKLKVLHDTVQASLARGGEHDADDVETYLDQVRNELSAQGY